SGISATFNSLAWIASDPAEASALTEKGLAVAREIGDPQAIAHSLYLLGSLARKRGDLAHARAYWDECASQDAAAGVRGGFVLFALGELALEQDDRIAAQGYFAKFVAARQEIQSHSAVASGLLGLSAVAVAMGQSERAARLMGASQALYAASVE